MSNTQEIDRNVEKFASEVVETTRWYNTLKNFSAIVKAFTITLQEYFYGS